jgi:hypothetical protein
MVSLGDLVRQRVGAVDAPPGGGTLGDLVRQQAAQSAPPEGVGPPAPPAEPPPAAGTQAGAVIGQALAPPPGEPPLREPTWGETIGLGAARVVPPIVAGAVTTPFLSPAGGIPAAALAGTLGDVVAQRYERAHGLRREVRPYQSIVSGAAAAVPGTELAPEVGLATRAAVRAAEGAGINTAATVAESGLEEHRLPTLGDVVRSAATGAAFGGVAGTAEHGIRTVVSRRGGTPEAAPADVAETPIPPAARTTAPASETPAAAQPLEPVRMVTQPGETIGPVPQQQAQTSAQGGPPPVSAARAPAAPPVRPEPGPAPRVSEAVEAPPGVPLPPPFQRVPGLGEAMMGAEVPPARPAPAERLETQQAHVQRVWGHLPQEAQDIIAYTTRDNADALADVGRQTQPVARTQRLGQDLVFDPERAAKQPRGTTWNAEQFASANQSIEAQARTIQQLREAYEADPTSDAAALRLQRAATELDMSVRAYQGRTTEAGRSLNILKYQSAALDSGDPRFIREAVRVGASADDIAKVLKTPNLDDAARYRELLRIRRPGRLQYLNTYLTQNILSGIPTQERNIIGNTVPLLAQPATRPIAGAMDWARVAAMGGERRVYAREVFPMVAGYVDAITPAAKGVYHILTKGYSPEQALNFELPHPELLPSARPGVRTAANIVLRGLNAMDYGFRTLHEQGEFRSLAYRNARNDVLREVAAGRIPESEMQTALADRTQYYRDNPTDAMLKETRDVGARGVYQESGKVDRALIYARDNIPGGRYALWFVRTPLNILRQGVQLTPAGLLTKQGRPVALGGVGGRAGTQARAEAALGTFLMAPIAMLAARGQLTGAGPSDPAEIDDWRAQGKQPNSIRIGGHWYGYGALGPLAIPLATIANGYEAAARLQKEGVVGWQEQSERIAAQVGRGLYRTMLQQSYLKGLSDIQDAVDDESGRKFQRLVANTALMVVPGSGMVRGVAQAEDPVLRQPESTAEALRLQLPVSHADIPPRIRATGEPIVSRQPGGFAGRLLLPTQVSPATDTPVRAELRRLGIPLSVPHAGKIATPEHPQGEKPPRADALAIAQAKGYAQEAALEKVLARPDWARIDDRVKRARITQVKLAMTGAIATRAKVLTKRGEPITLEALWPPALGAPPPTP